jgi:hypothetical protein
MAAVRTGEDKDEEVDGDEGDEGLPNEGWEVLSKAGGG